MIRTPVPRIAVNDHPHEAMLRALGVEDRIVAVGGHMSYDDDLRRMARSGEIRQIGYGWHMPPTLDALVAARPDVLIARMADLTHTRHKERVESLGIPVVPTFIDAEPRYMDHVAWVRPMGSLTGKEAEADAFVVLGAEDDPALDTFSDLSTERLLRDATDADCRMIRDPLSARFDDRDVLSRFKAYREGCVFREPGERHPVADSWEVWEMGTIRPDWRLADIVKMLHRERRDGEWPSHRKRGRRTMPARVGTGGFAVGTPDALSRSGAVGRAFDTDAIRFSPSHGRFEIRPSGPSCPPLPTEGRGWTWSLGSAPMRGVLAETSRPGSIRFSARAQGCGWPSIASASARQAWGNAWGGSRRVGCLHWRRTARRYSGPQRASAHSS